MPITSALFVTAVLIGGLTHTGSAAKFDYNPCSLNGPSHWVEQFQLCGGSHQSPINIATSHVDYGRIINLTYSHLSGQPVSGTFTNNGHSLQFTLDSADSLHLTGVPFAANDTYKLLQLHFHWGSNYLEGSEHTVDGVAFPAEMHFVHYNTKYGGLASAVQHSDGLAVIGVFLKESWNYNDELSRMLGHVNQILDPGSNVVIQTSPYSMIPRGKFYTYSGSLTTPGCNESVTWIVMKDPIDVIPAAMDEMRQAKGSNGNRIAVYGNYRPIQRGYRLVFANFVQE